MNCNSITEALAQIGAEILFQGMAIFCGGKKATSGSSFFILQKKALPKKIEAESWIKLQKKIKILC